MERFQVEEVPGPRLERDVQAVAEIVTAALVDRVGSRVRETPRLPAQVVPRERDVALGARLAQVYDHERSWDLAAPAPGDEVLPAVVAVPAAALGQLPLPGAEDVVLQAAEQPLVERAQVGVRLLVGTAGEEDRQLCPAALELPLVDEPRARLSQGRRRRRTSLARREGRCRPRLVMVLEKADEL